jgi:hypothetical protein
MTNKLLLGFNFIILLLLSNVGLAQIDGFSVNGTVYESANTPALGASVDLLDENKKPMQSLFVDENGQYLFEGLENKSYFLQISQFEYLDTIVAFKISNNNLTLNTITLQKSKVEQLGTINFQVDRTPVQQKGDTTQFDAGAFKTNPDATAEDLLRKMPGMDMSSGSPKAQGENITKVLVDGKPFFGDDPSAALKNLPAEIIDKIQLYDEKSEQSQFTGFDDGNTSKTLNITTRKDKKEGLFGKLFVGGGSDIGDNNANKQLRYSNGGTLNYFNGTRRITLMGLNNNINQQNFSTQDIVGAGSGASGGGGMRGGGAGGRGGGGMNNMSMGSNQGINRTNALGLNYTDFWGDKVEVNGSYIFNNTKNNTEQDILRLYQSQSQSGQEYRERNESNSTNFNHRINGRIKYTIDSNNTLLLMPSVSYQNNKSISNSSAQTSLINSILNKTQNSNDRKSEGINANLRALFSHKFAKPGRSASLWLDGGYNNTSTTNTLQSLTEDILATINDTLNQRSLNDRNGFNTTANLSYTEPLSKRSGLQFRYKYGHNYSNSDKKTYNASFNNEYNLLDNRLSNVFNSTYITNGAEIGYRFNEKNYDFNLALEYQNAALNGDRTMPVVTEINRNFNNVLPSARMKYAFSKTSNLRVFYRSYSRNPSVDQLQDVINNSNPLQLTSGNPDLKQSINHDVRAMYNTASVKNNSTFFAMASANFVNDYIGNSLIIADQPTSIQSIDLPRGGQFSKPINLDGYKNFNGFVTYGKLISPIKTNINLNFSGGFSATPSLVNNVKNIANSTNLGLGVVFSSNISENIDYTLSSTASLNNIKNTLNTSGDNKFYNQTTRFNLNYIFLKGFVLNTELNHQYFEGQTAAFNTRFLLWNASLGKKFYNNQAEVKLQVYDILGQNKAIATSSQQGLYTQSTISNVLQRYFLVTFTWNLRYFKGSSSEKDMENKNDFRPTGNMPAPGMLHPGMLPPGHP